MSRPRKPRGVVARFLDEEGIDEIAEDIRKRDALPMDIGPAIMRVESAIRRALKKARRDALAAEWDLVEHLESCKRRNAE